MSGKCVICFIEILLIGIRFAVRRCPVTLPVSSNFLTPTQAELIKYSKNTFYAMKVIFANQMYDICEKLEEDWGAIKEIITAPQDQQIGDSHLDPIFGLRRGFGGKCLPKDSQALAVLAESLSCKYNLLQAIQDDNKHLRNILTGKPSDVITQDD